MKYAELKQKFKRDADEKSGFMRELTVDPNSIDKENSYAEFSVSSEFPVLRWFGYEILDHSAGSIRLGRLLDGAAHRDGHYGDQIGIVTKAWIDESSRKLRVGVRFSKNTPRAVEMFNDIADGIRRNVSIDYDIHAVQFEKEVEGVEYYRVIDWEPIHTCHTPDGADPTVGNGRSAESPTTIIPFDLDGDIQQQIEDINRENDNKIKIVLNNRSTDKMTEEEKKKLAEEQRAAVEKATREAGERETLRIRGIRMMAKDLQRNVPGVKLEDEAEKFIAEGKGERDFYSFVSEKMKDPQAVRTPEAHIDASQREMDSYSISKAILALADGDTSKLGIEREMSDTLKKKLNRETKGLLIPTNVLRGIRAAAQNVTTPAQGGNTVNEQVISQSFVEYLHNSLLAVQAGVTFLPGMSGNVPFIRELTENSFYWAGESGHPTESGITFSRVDATPKLGGAKTSISRQMLLQSGYVSEAYCKRKLIGASQRGIDKSIFYGLGTGAQPLGIKNLTGIHSVVGTDYTRTKAIEQVSAIRNDNAEKGALNFVTNSLTKGVLQTKNIVPNYPVFLCNDDNVMVARKVLDGSMIDSGDLFYGAFNTILLLEWGFLDISTNAFGAGWDAGDIEVRALAAVDTFYEYPQALSLATGVS